MNKSCASKLTPNMTWIKIAVVLNPSVLLRKANFTESTHPAILPPIRLSCSRNARKVIREKPRNVGNFFDLKKPRTLCFFEVEFWDSVETRVDVEGETRVLFDAEGIEFALDAVIDALAVELSLSAGCLAGSATSGLELLASPWVSAPSTYPISPRFEGSGSACGCVLPDDESVVSALDSEAIDAMIVRQLTLGQNEKTCPWQDEASESPRRKKEYAI